MSVMLKEDRSIGNTISKDFIASSCHQGQEGRNKEKQEKTFIIFLKWKRTNPSIENETETSGNMFR
ncbi:CLUMA_CG004356, isoform A [Clunio marinus]|uniref:CLUMA_CG004356, isoform A n=1 Tax=Clunio marinus TaxID=568069 RepID=A0A1J1HRH9_9DIPT|nr:CLUMA_CG004356, isoform A [Clunio marinus]